MRKKTLGKKAATVLLASTLALGGAGAMVTVTALAPTTAGITPTAQAKTITQSGTFYGNGTIAQSDRSITKAWISKGKLNIKGKIWKDRNGVDKAYKKGTYTFRLAKNCKFGSYEEEFLTWSQKKFESKALKKLNVGTLYVDVKNGKAVRVYRAS